MAHYSDKKRRVEGRPFPPTSVTFGGTDIGALPSLVTSSAPNSAVEKDGYAYSRRTSDPRRYEYRRPSSADDGVSADLASIARGGATSSSSASGDGSIGNNFPNNELDSSRIAYYRFGNVDETDGNDDDANNWAPQNAHPNKAQSAAVAAKGLRRGFIGDDGGKEASSSVASAGAVGSSFAPPRQHNQHYEILPRRVPTDHAVPDTVLVNDYGDEYGLEYVASTPKGSREMRGDRL